jgi:hypothetical protein
MSKNPEPLQGHAAIEEAAQLLRQMRFSHRQGAYAEGRYVAISADPRWNADMSTFRVQFSCLAFGHRHVDWNHLPLHIAPEDRNAGIHVLTHLNSRGQAFVPNLSPGEYRLTLRFRPPRRASVLSAEPDRLAAQSEDEREERQVWQGESEDGAILWSIEAEEEGDVQVAFETSLERWAGAVIVFSLIDPASQQIRYSRQLTLEPTRLSAKWEAWCSIGSRTEFQGPYELEFEILGSDGSPV